MQSEIDKYNEILAKHFSGRLTTEERDDLECWRKLSDDNEKAFAQFERTFAFADRLGQMRKINSDKDLFKLKGRLFDHRKAARPIDMIQKAAAILTIPLLLATIWSVYNLKQYTDRTFASVVKETETAYGLRTQITLSDGTVVWLNSGSKLIYPETFDQKIREVTLEGEGFFKVTSNEKHPFVVNAKNLKVRATGTEFNIACYGNEPNIEILLAEGNVSLLTSQSSNDQLICKLLPGEMATYHKDANRVSVQKVDMPKYLAWTQGKLVFRNDKMNDVITRLGRWYNTDISLEGDELSDYFYTATFDGETIGQILDLLKYSAPIDYHIVTRSKHSDNTFGRQQIIIKTKKKKGNK
jgi:transmembrane sensor